MRRTNGKALNRANRRQLNKENSTKAQRRERDAADDMVKDYKDTYMSKSNPYAWYANFPNYAKDVATLAFGVPVGTPIFVDGDDYVTNAGIMTLTFSPSVGLSTSLVSPINRQATRFQSYLRSVQRAAATYDAADTMIYMIGVDSLYMFWAYMRRAYGVAQLFTPTNRYYPKRLLHMMAIDDSIVANLADFRAYINRFALNIGRYTMPKNFDLLYRHIWMTSGLYLDSNTTRAQTYMFVPKYFFKYDNTYTSGGKLTATNLFSDNAITAGTGKLTLADLISFGDALLNNFENDDDTMNISGDLFRAFGQSGVFVAEETPDNYAVLPVYDQTVSSQIENSILMGNYYDESEPTDPTNARSIYQNVDLNNGAIIFNPVLGNAADVIIKDLGQGKYLYGRNYAGQADNTLLNAHWDSPTPEQVMEMTRLINKFQESGLFYEATQSIGHHCTELGSDIVHGMFIMTGARNSTTGVSVVWTRTNTVYESTDGVPYNKQAISIESLLMQFDWAPMLYMVVTDATGVDSSHDLQIVAADVDNMTAVTRGQLDNIHEAALLSLLDTPQVIVH